MRIGKVRFHSQNLNEDKRGEPKGTILKHGRAWLNLGSRLGIHWEWVLFTLRFGFSVSVNCHDDDIMFSIGLPGFQFYLGFEGIFPRKWKTYDLGRRIGFSIHDYALWIDVWRDENGWSRDMPWYAKGFHFDPMDFLFGRMKSEHRTIEAREAVIAMPEANYPVKIEIQEWFWKRPRWPRWPLKRRLLRAHVEPAKPVPVPGKGENSWDCDEDAIHSSTFCCETIPDAIAEFTADLLKTRARHGGINWKPEKEPA